MPAANLIQPILAWYTDGNDGDSHGGAMSDDGDHTDDEEGDG